VAIPDPRSVAGRNFWLSLTTASVQCLCLLWALFHWGIDLVNGLHNTWFATRMWHMAAVILFLFSIHVAGEICPIWTRIYNLPNSSESDSYLDEIGQVSACRVVKTAPLQDSVPRLAGFRGIGSLACHSALPLGPSRGCLSPRTTNRDPSPLKI